jgi:hypothetical protein
LHPALDSIGQIDHARNYNVVLARAPAEVIDFFSSLN